jgi:hypothetical protein
MRWDEEYRLAARRHRRRRQIERLLAPRWTPRQAARWHRSAWGRADDPRLEASLLRDFGPVTDEERALEARISREHRLVERALKASLARETMQSLAQHIERAYGVPYVKDLTDDQLDDLEAWVARREELKDRRRRADV